MNEIFEKTFWWEAEENVHSVIHKYIDVLRDEQVDFYNDMDTYVGLYGGQPLNAVHLPMFSASNRSRLTFNIIHSLCQAATSKIAKHKPGISFLTSGGDWSQRRKAQLLEKFIQGQIYSTKAYALAQKAFLDACITGTGVLKVFSSDGAPKIERVPLAEMTLDTAEASSSEPRQLFQTKKISRHVLAAQFPESKDEILSYRSEDDSSESSGRQTDMIVCHESWHLPSGKDAEDGRHVISIENTTLLDEVYERNDFPFVFIRWTESPVCFWGNGLAKEVKGIQVEINQLLRQIQEQMHLATPKIFIEEGSKVSSAHLNNRTWGVIKYRGNKPDFFVPRAVSGETFQHLDRLVSQAYEMTGISQLSAQSKKPVGLDSGRALREFSDIESERFMVVGQAYEEVFIEISRQVIELVKELVTSGEKFSSMSFSEESGVQHIKWKEIKLKDDEYVMRIMPVGSLPQSKAAKVATVTEMFQNGMFTATEAHRLLDFPDLEQANKMKTSHIDLVDKMIDDILDKGRYEPPEPYMDLQLALERAQMAYNLAKIEEVPAKRLDLLRRWLNHIAGLIEQSQPQSPALPPGVPGMPEVPAGMPPQLLPLPPEGGGPLPALGGPGLPPGIGPDAGPLPAGGPESLPSGPPVPSLPGPMPGALLG
jgi:hypothetical protein